MSEITTITGFVDGAFYAEGIRTTNAAHKTPPHYAHVHVWSLKGDYLGVGSGCNNGRHYGVSVQDFRYVASDENFWWLPVEEK